MVAAFATRLLQIAALVSIGSVHAGAAWDHKLSASQSVSRPRPAEAILQSARDSDFAAVVADLLSVSPKPNSVIQIRANKDTRTAAASREWGRLIIDYNPEFVASVSRVAKTDWAIVLVLAHEVAHLLAGHANPGANTQADFAKMEHDADHAAGFLLARVGAPATEIGRALRTACQLDGVSDFKCAEYEDALRAGWQTALSRR